MTRGRQCQFRPGLVSVTYRQLTPEAVVDLAVDARLEGIEWGGDIHVPHGDTKRATEVRQRTEDAGLSVVAYGSYYRLASDGVDHEPAFETVLETAVALNAPALRVWAGRTPSVEADEAHWARLAQEAIEIASLAASAGVTVVFEHHKGTLTDTTMSARRLLQEVGPHGLRLGWQPPVGMPVDTVCDDLEQLLAWTVHVHTFSWWPDAEHRHPLADGEVAWRRYLDVLRQDTVPRWLLLEFVPDDDPAVLAREAATLRSWLI